MPSISVEFEVYCGICGSGCCRGTDVYERRGSTRVTIECPSCKGTIKGLEARVADLENELAEAQTEIEKLKEESDAHYGRD